MPANRVTLGGPQDFVDARARHASVCPETFAVRLRLLASGILENGGDDVPHRMGVMATPLLALSLGGCAFDRDDEEASVGDSDRPVAIVRTTTLHWEGEQTYIPLYADGTASGLAVVNFNGGLLFGTLIPDSWTWLHRDTVEICFSTNVLRNEVGFPPMERQCAPHPITGKELDLDGDGTIDLIETFDIVHPLFHRNRPSD